MINLFSVTICILLFGGVVIHGQQNPWINDLHTVLTNAGLREDLPINSYIGTLVALGVSNAPPPTYSTTSTFFSVDPTSGNVTLSAALNYGNSPNFTVDFYANFFGINYQPVAHILVIVLPVNHAPYFDQQMYTTSIKDDVASGTTVYSNIFVTDQDIGSNGTVMVSCNTLSGNSEATQACQTFNLITTVISSHQLQVSVILNGALNYATKRNYNISMLAVDGGTPPLSGSASITINIDNSKDTSPIFFNTPITMSVTEMQANGSIVGTIQAIGAVAPNTPILFQIISDSLNFFYLGTTTISSEGVSSVQILTTGRVNHVLLTSSSSQYTFTIAAIVLLSNGQPSTVSSVTIVNVQIIDINNNPPTFQRSTYTASVAQGVPSGSVIPALSMIITDLDSGTNAFFLLSATSSGTFPDTFGIVPSYGQGTVAATLVVNRPDQLVYAKTGQSQFTVTCVAKESYTSQHFTGQATVTINILNPNNQPTPFNLAIYTASIQDNYPTGALVTVVSNSYAPNSQGITYGIQSGNQLQFFSLDSLGEVRVAKLLNATAASLVTLVVFANNSFGLISTTTVAITIQNSASLGPTFYPPTYQTTVLEGTTIMNPPVIIVATPLQHDVVTIYTLLGNYSSIFYIQLSADQLSCTLMMNHSVDFNDTPNKQGFYLLTIQAVANTNGPTYTNTTTISVTIQDTNNHVPTFNTAVYNGNLTEITPTGTSVVQVNATDLDYGINAVIGYQLGVGGRDNFAIDYTTGVVSVAYHANLNIKSIGQDQYSMPVYAVDGGTPPQTGTATVNIHVYPSVYQVPVFAQTAYQFTVLDSSPIATTVGLVQAVSPDTLANLIYRINVKSWAANNSNGLPAGNISYQSSFGVNSTTGIITILQNLNHDYTAVVTFAVEAVITNFDRPIAVPYANVTIFINQAPVTPNAVIFYLPAALVNGTYTTNIVEQRPVGTLITQFSAYQNSLIINNFFLGPTNDPSSYLSLDNVTGALTVAKNITYDTLTSKTLTYQIIAIAPAPNPASATVTINVNVHKINEYFPVFTSPTYYFNVSENVPLNTYVGGVMATLFVPGSISYKLTGSNSVDFAINATGVITVNNPLDAERTHYYILTVTTVDNGPLKLIQPTAATVIINIGDINEFPPAFLNSPYSANLQETDSTNTYVAHIQAIDPDISNTTVTYAIVGGNNQGLFVIDPATGIVTTTRNMTGYASPVNYVLNISATDSGKPAPLTAYTTLNISVQSVAPNGGVPIFTQPAADSQAFGVYEGIVNAFVTNLSAITSRGQYQFITFTFAPIQTNEVPFKKFNITPITTDTSQLRTMVALNRTVQSQYSILIFAVDNGPTNEKTSQRTIIVNVYSSNPPTFPNCFANFSAPTVIASVDQLLPTASYVTNVTAFLFYFNPQIYYYITGTGNQLSNNNSAFSIDPRTGVIQTASVLHWILNPVFTINVTATVDANGPTSALNIPGATTSVIVYVNGTDVSGPSFDNTNVLCSRAVCPFCYGINSSVSEGILDITGYYIQVIQMYAGDCDSPQYRGHIFSLSSISFFYPPNSQSSQSMSNAFSIDPLTGYVYTGETSYRPYTDGKFLLTVVATDSQGRSAQSALTVFIVRENQRLRFVFSKGPKDINPIINPFSAEVTNQLVNVSKVSNTMMMPNNVSRVHINAYSDLWFNESDLCFYVMQGGGVLSMSATLGLFADFQTNFNSNYSQFYVIPDANDPNSYTPVPCNIHITTRWWSGYWFLWWLLIALALFIFVIALVLIICVCIYWPKSKQNYFTNRPYIVLDDPLMMSGGASDFEFQQSTIHRFN